MTLKQIVANFNTEHKAEVCLNHIENLDTLKDALIVVMNTSGVATGLGTHYNTRQEELNARTKAAKELFEMDRGLFLMIHALNGVTDNARQTAIKALLMNNWDRFSKTCLDKDAEMDGIKYLATSLPANRLLNLFVELRENHANNSRTKKQLILTYLLNHTNLEWWAVKYRKKMRAALEHAWDKRTTSVIRALINKDISDAEKNGLSERIDRYLRKDTDKQKVYECISFILGNDDRFSLPLFKAFKDAKVDIAKGRILPPEVLEGIRSMYHKNVSQKAILELTRDTSMTEKKKSLIQRKARKEKVQIAFNPMARTATELYIMAYAQGMTKEIWDALMLKARAGAKSLPVRFEKVGILVDDSFSMTGSVAQKLRPMAVSLAMKDVLENIGNTSIVKTISGRRINRDHPIPKPVGSTDLALPLIDLIENGVDAVFILSDGYENAPSGRVDEVMILLDKIGNRTPVYQINPVIGSETRQGLKILSDRIPSIPVSHPQALSLTLMRAMIEVDIKKGIQALADMTVPKFAKNQLFLKKQGVA